MKPKMTKKEFNEIKKRILAQVHPLAKDYLESDLLKLWREIKGVTQ